jgi:hypothetical protein
MSTCSKCGTIQAAGAILGNCRACGQDLAANAGVGLQVRIAIAWERIDEWGALGAFWRTTNSVLFRPADFFDAAARSSDTFFAWTYGLVAGSIGLIAGYLIASITPSTGVESLEMLGLGAKGYSATSFLWAPVIISLNCIFMSLYCHLLLALRHHRKKPIHATFRAICYAQSSALLAVIPYFGSIVSPLWFCYLVIVGISRTHETGRMQTLILLAVPLVFLTLLFFFIMIMLLMAGIIADGFYKGFFDLFR